MGMSMVVLRFTRWLGSGSRHDRAGSGLVQDEALDWVEVARPGLELEHPASVRVAGFAAPADTVGAEVDVLGVVLAFERRCQQADHVHAGQAAEAGKLLHVGFLAL